MSETYEHFCEAAAKAERAGDCAQAVKYWHKAEILAKTNNQKLWCNNRLIFLNRWGYRIEQRMSDEQE